MNTPKKRVTLNDLREPQQMRELNRQMEWVWNQLMGGLTRKALSAGLNNVIESKASRESVEEVGGAVTRQSTLIQQNAAAIALKADAETVNALGNRVTSAESSITLQADEIASKVGRTEFDALGNRMTSAESSITQQAGEIASKVGRTEFDALGNRVTSAESSITQQAGEIASKVGRTEFDVLGGRVSAAESSISQTPGLIQSAVRAVSIGGTNLVQSGEGKVNARNAAATYGWQKSAHSQGQHGYEMKAFASGDYSEVTFIEPVDFEAGEYTLSFWCWRYGVSGIPALWATVITSGNEDYPFALPDSMRWTDGAPERVEMTMNVSYTGKAYLRFVATQPWGSGSVYISDVKLERGNKATAWSPAPEDVEGEIGALSGRVSTAESSITQQAGLIASKVSQTDFNALSGRVSTAESSISQTPAMISAAVAAIDEFHAGSRIDMTQDRVRISTPEFDVTINESNEGFHLAKEGGSMDNLSVGKCLYAPNIAEKYGGAASVTVGTGAGTDYRSLQELANAVNGKTLTRDVTVTIESDQWGDVALAGVGGGYHLTIDGGAHTLTGNLILYGNSALLAVNNLTIADGGVQANGCAFVSLESDTLNGKGNGVQDVLLRVAEGTRMRMYDCGLYNATHLIYVTHTCDLSMFANRGGNCDYFLYGDGATVRAHITRPAGALKPSSYPCFFLPADPATVQVDYGSATPPVAPIQTATLACTDSGTCFGTSRWNGYGAEDRRVRQGYVNLGSYGADEASGCFWFDRTSIAGKTILSASLRLTRAAGFGRAAEAEVTLYTTGATGRNGSPGPGTPRGALGRIANGETKEFAIPTAAAQALADGAVGFMLRTGENALLNGRTYSANYAVFAGCDEAERPVLTVTYQ